MQQWPWVFGAWLGSMVGCPASADEPPRASPPAVSGVAAPSTRSSAPVAMFEDRLIPWDSTQVMRVLGHLAENLTSSEYAHVTRVNEKAGIYVFDCSGFVHWALRKAAPRASAAVSQGAAGRPLARDFQRTLARVPFGRRRGGWQRIRRVDEARPGDVIAWIKPGVIQSPYTGHVAFIVLPPQPVPHLPHAYLLRVADSTSLLHDDDTREGRSGFGLGTILLMSDAESGEPRAYGWVGLRWRTFDTAIAIGRPLG